MRFKKKKIYNFVETQFQTKISILQASNGTEYFNEYLSDFLKEKMQSTTVHVSRYPSINWNFLKKKKHLLEVVAIIFSVHVSKYLWKNTILIATYLINRMASKILSFRTPLQSLQNVFPACGIHFHFLLKVFACITYVQISVFFIQTIS